MITNESATIFHKRQNKETRLEEWDMYHIKFVMWQGGRGANINKGYDKANDINVWIPYSKNQELKSIPLSIGDIIVKGIINTNINKQSDLKIEQYNITTIIDNCYGDDNMWHIQLGAK